MVEKLTPLIKGTPFSEKLNEMKRCIEDFEFELAQEILKEITSGII
jgi:hypothetical protein